MPETLASSVPRGDFFLSFSSGFQPRPRRDRRRDRLRHRPRGPDLDDGGRARQELHARREGLQRGHAARLSPGFGQGFPLPRGRVVWLASPPSIESSKEWSMILPSIGHSEEHVGDIFVDNLCTWRSYQTLFSLEDPGGFNCSRIVGRDFDFEIDNIVSSHSRFHVSMANC